jgi:NADPH-dependent 2,4-dienoyl-CoA reductase/sulfur reductase-like enzyme
MDDGHVMIVGAGLGGLRAAEQLRAAGHSGPVTLLGAEPHLPYNRPPLSKELLAEAAGLTLAQAHEKVVFRRRASIADVTFRLGQPVVAADLAGGTLALADGADVAFDGLVIATGLRPRRLPLPRAIGVPAPSVLRTLDDSLALRAALTPGTRIAIIGGGFVGCEVAGTALSLGCEVTVIEVDQAPMLRVLGPELATAIQRSHEAAGIRFIGTEMAVTDGDLRHLTGGFIATYQRDGRHVGTVTVNIPPNRHRPLREALLTAALVDSVGGGRAPSHRRARDSARRN